MRPIDIVEVVEQDGEEMEAKGMEATGGESDQFVLMVSREEKKNNRKKLEQKLQPMLDKETERTINVHLVAGKVSL